MTHPQNKGNTTPAHEIFDLTLREWEVLLLIADDFTTAEISEKLGITEKSVENNRNRIGCNLNLKGKGKLARYARKHKEDLRTWYKLLMGASPPPDNSTSSSEN